MCCSACATSDTLVVPRPCYCWVNEQVKAAGTLNRACPPGPFPPLPLSVMTKFFVVLQHSTMFCYVQDSTSSLQGVLQAGKYNVIHWHAWIGRNWGGGFRASRRKPGREYIESFRTECAGTNVFEASLNRLPGPSLLAFPLSPPSPPRPPTLWPFCVSRYR